MIGRVRLPFGLLGQILLVLLLTVLVEFTASTVLFERRTEFFWREDEARRLAEHLVIARKLLAERTPAERPTIAQELTTERYGVNWAPGTPPPPPTPAASDLIQIQQDILAWEPVLQTTNLRLSLPPFRPRIAIIGALQLPDESWMYFSAHGETRRWDYAIERSIAALIPALGLLLISSLIIGRVLRPIRHLVRATERIGTKDPVLLPEEGTREARRLIRAFNEMQSRITRLVADRIEALAAVGHDIRTPLSRIQLRLDAIRDDVLRDEIEADLLEIEGMIASLLAFIGGEDDPEPPQRIDLAVLVSTIVSSAADGGAAASYDGPDHLVISARPIALRRAITNLVENAIHYGGRAEVTLREEKRRLVICVEDHGAGIPEKDLETVLEPFVRLDAARARNTRGLGLGLSIVVRAVEHEGGHLRLSNREAGGLRAEILLPRPTGNDSLQ